MLLSQTKPAADQKPVEAFVQLICDIGGVRRWGTLSLKMNLSKHFINNIKF